MTRSHPATVPAGVSKRPTWFRAVATGFALVLTATACGSSSSDGQPSDTQADSSSSDTGSQAGDQATTDQVDEGESEPDSSEDTTDTGSSGELVSGSVEVDGGLITTVHADGSYAKSTVLFLHGAAYTSQTWVQNEILAAVADAGIDAIAVDLPGFGTSGRTGLEDEEFLAGLFMALDLDPTTTTVVSPSMSGGFSLPALRQPFFAGLAGFVPVAPVGVSGFISAGPALETPALVVWGDGDGGDPQEAAEALAAGFTNSEVLILPDAGHAAYQQQPELFAQALIDFVEQNETN